ncbi:MAG: NosD domain-containing protein [Thermoplasmataceae archaeon]
MYKKFLIAVVSAVIVISLFTVGFGNHEANITHSGIGIPALGANPVYKGNVTIYSNGTVSNLTAIGSVGNNYTLKENVSGTITDMRNNSIFYGGGFTVNGRGGTSIIVINSHSVELARLNLTNSSSDVYIVNSTSVSIQKSQMVASAYGVQVSYGTEIYLNDSIITAATGFGIDNPTHLILLNNDSFNVTSCGVNLGISNLYTGSDLTLEHSKINGNGKASNGFSAEYAITNNVSVFDNTLTGFGSNGIYVGPDSGTNVSVYGNKVTNSSHGIYIYDSANVTIADNTVSNSTARGIRLQYVYNSVISSNDITNFTVASAYGIYAQYSYGKTIINHNSVYGNLSVASTVGIYVRSTAPATIYGNNVQNMSTGVYLLRDGSISAFDNTILNDGTGIQVLSSIHFSIFGNSITNSGQSIYSSQSYWGVFYDNTVTNGSTYMLVIQNSQHLSFYHNNFLNGSKIKTDFSYNTFVSWNLSLPTGGNYWSNYTGKGSNGIGSTPYRVNGSEMDYLPLTSPWIGYTVTFTESGLPAGTAWSVTLGSQTIDSTSSTIVFTPDAAQNVSESYSISHVSGFGQSLRSGTLSLNRSSMAVTVNFSVYKYTFTFTYSGLPKGTSWSVTFNGVKESSNTSTITFSAANGTYSYSVGSVSGYTVAPSSGNVTLNGSNGNLTVSFTHQTSGASSSTSLYQGLVIGGIAGVIAGILGSMFYNGTWIFRKFRKKEQS